MKKVLLSLAAVSAIAAASPAAAQVWGYGPNNISREINERQALVSQRIDQAIHRGLVSRQEAYSLTTELRNFQRVERQYRYGGLSRSEVANLDWRLNKLEHKLRTSVRDRDGRAYGYGYGNSYGYRR